MFLLGRRFHRRPFGVEKIQIATTNGWFSCPLHYLVDVNNCRYYKIDNVIGIGA